MKQATNKQTEVKKFNLDAVKNLLSKVDLQTKKERVNLYIYPGDINTEALRNGKKGKAFRQSLRKKLDNFANQILLLVKYDRTPELPGQISEFKKFYKTFYRINDFSVTSVSQREDAKNELIKIMFDVILNFDAKNAKKEKKTPVVKKEKIKKEETPATPTEETPA